MISERHKRRKSKEWDLRKDGIGNVNDKGNRPYKNGTETYHRNDCV